MEITNGKSSLKHLIWLFHESKSITFSSSPTDLAPSTEEQLDCWAAEGRSTGYRCAIIVPLSFLFSLMEMCRLISPGRKTFPCTEDISGHFNRIRDRKTEKQKEEVNRDKSEVTSGTNDDDGNLIIKMILIIQLSCLHHCMNALQKI